MHLGSVGTVQYILIPIEASTERQCCSYNNLRVI